MGNVARPAVGGTRTNLPNVVLGVVEPADGAREGANSLVTGIIPPSGAQMQARRASAGGRRATSNLGRLRELERRAGRPNCRRAVDAELVMISEERQSTSVDAPHL